MINPALPSGGNGHISKQNDPHQSRNLRDAFRRFAATTATAVGSPAAFLLAVITIIAWAVSGPVFHYSDTWQLVINTSTTIITFLMVFLIQSTQNRDARAIHLKLDELIARNREARNRLVDLQEWSDEELDRLEQEFHRLRDRSDQNRNDAVA